jgi:hypothetical protein
MRKSNFNKKNRKNNAPCNTQLASVGKIKQLSFLGPTTNRAIDVVLPVYAVNTLSGGYYSLGTSTSAPTITANITSQAISQFTEYSALVKDFGLVQIKSLDISIYRSSNYINRTTDITNLPSFSFQISPSKYSAGTTAIQQNIATSDTSAEFNVSTFDAFAYRVVFPPVISGRSDILSDISTYGSSVWCPTVVNGTQCLPDIFLNLGSLQFPSFTNVPGYQAYQIASIHLRLNVVFASPQTAL